MSEVDLNKLDNNFTLIINLLEEDNIDKNLKKILMIIRNLMGAKNIFIYKLGEKSEELMYYSYSEDDSNEKGSYYINSRISEIGVATNKNRYLVLIDDNNIKNQKLYAKYMKALQKIFELVFMKIELKEKMIIKSNTNTLTK